MGDQLRKEVGARIRELRQRNGVSQAKLAAALDLTQAQIANYERGACTPYIESLIGIADFFDVSLDYICGRNEEGRHQFLKQEIIEKKSTPELEDLAIQIPEGMNLFEFIRSTVKQVIEENNKASDQG